MNESTYDQLRKDIMFFSEICEDDRKMNNLNSALMAYKKQNFISLTNYYRWFTSVPYSHLRPDFDIKDIKYVDPVSCYDSIDRINYRITSKDRYEKSEDRILSIRNRIINLKKERYKLSKVLSMSHRTHDSRQARTSYDGIKYQIDIFSKKIKSLENDLNGAVKRITFVKNLN